MNNLTWQHLNEKFEEFPILKGEGVPITEIDAVSTTLGMPFPEDYREFVHRYGSAMVGAFPIFGLRPAEVMGNDWSVIDVNQDYRTQQ